MNIFLYIYFALVIELEVLQASNMGERYKNVPTDSESTSGIEISKYTNKKIRGAWYVSGDSNGVLIFWDRELNALGELHREFPIRCGIHLREGKFAVGMNTGETGKVEIWKTGEEEPIAKLYLGQENIPNVLGYNSRDRLYIGYKERGDVDVFEVKGDYGRMRSLRGHLNSYNMNSILFHSNSHIFTGGDDGTMRVWDSEGYPINTYKGFRNISTISEGNIGDVVIASKDSLTSLSYYSPIQFHIPKWTANITGGVIGCVAKKYRKEIVCLGERKLYAYKYTFNWS